MRYNPDTERGLTFEAHVEESRVALQNLPKPLEREFLWDCTNGSGWVRNPNFIPSLV